MEKEPSKMTAYILCLKNLWDIAALFYLLLVDYHSTKKYVYKGVTRGGATQSKKCKGVPPKFEVYQLAQVRWTHFFILSS